MIWKEIWKPLSENLIWVCIMFGMFALCVLANIIAGIYYHIRLIGQTWNSFQLGISILRMLAIGVSTAILAVVSTVAPLILSHLGLMDDDFSRLISVTLIVGMYMRGIVKYFKEALATVDNILSNRDIVGELQTIPPKDLEPQDPPS
ncbi:hypothetical protein GPL15_22990 [Clostridium sp. MCC353]|uniref:hypothetical protein n=1 Tax=Clostridium sp. MCC353 TaxID=2592646 RepID=UPI001C037CE1|nr:hypothetical protein [Clostridium sp. MCC353]MBT9779349.1 hypothetical protein [Clostridium sp. MCC353]